ncbi:MAG: hypothetical protein M3256_22415, partial [Actinomycetota bacterium]|nr:hypothetical protein [Actinomycetota bacterium]
IVAMPAATIGTAGAKTRVLRVRGGFTSTNFSGPSCASPINLCAAGTFTGGIHGPFMAIATSLAPGPQPGVALGTADVVIHDSRGDLLCTETFVVNITPGGDGEEGDICHFTGGTREFANVSGHIEAYGSTPPGQINSGRYQGKLTRP